MNRNGPHMDPLIYLLVRCPSYSIQFSVIHIYTWVVCTCVCQYVQIQVFQHSQLKTLFCITQVNFTLVMVSLCTSGIFPCYFQAKFSLNSCPCTITSFQVFLITIIVFISQIIVLIWSMISFRYRFLFCSCCTISAFSSLTYL